MQYVPIFVSHCAPAGWVLPSGQHFIPPVIQSHASPAAVSQPSFVTGLQSNMKLGSVTQPPGSCLTLVLHSVAKSAQQSPLSSQSESQKQPSSEVPPHAPLQLPPGALPPVPPCSTPPTPPLPPVPFALPPPPVEGVPPPPF